MHGPCIVGQAVCAATVTIVGSFQSRTSSGPSSRRCCLMSARSPSLGWICRQGRGNSTRSTIGVWLWTKSDSARVSWTTSCLRLRGNGPHSFWPSCAKIFVPSIGSICSRPLLGRCDPAAFSLHRIRKGKCVELTASGRLTKCGDWILSLPYSSMPFRSNPRTVSVWGRRTTAATRASVCSHSTSKSQSRN